MAPDSVGLGPPCLLQAVLILFSFSIYLSMYFSFSHEWNEYFHCLLLAIFSPVSSHHIPVKVNITLDRRTISLSIHNRFGFAYIHFCCNFIYHTYGTLIYSFCLLHALLRHAAYFITLPSYYAFCYVQYSESMCLYSLFQGATVWSAAVCLIHGGVKHSYIFLLAGTRQKQLLRSNTHITTLFSTPEKH